MIDRERALRVLGWMRRLVTTQIAGYPTEVVEYELPDKTTRRDTPSDAELIGMLILELDRIWPCWSTSREKEFLVVGPNGYHFAKTRLGVLVDALEAAKGGNKE